MAQFYRTQREDRGRSRLLYATALVIIIFLLDMVAGGRLRALVRIPASYVYMSLTQLQQSVQHVGIFANQRTLQEENSRLKAELSTYHELDAEYSAMKNENARLRSLTGLAERVPGRTALVVSSLSASAYGTFMIDAGIEAGVPRGAVVFTPDGFAIGVVAETGNNSALVSQLFAPDATLEALVGATRIVLTGHGGGNARARAPRESAIAVGDIVHAPSVGAPVGVVEHVISESTGADKELFVRIPANLQTLSIVYVGRK